MITRCFTNWKTTTFAMMGIVSVLLLVGCGSNSSSSNSTPTATPTTKTFTVNLKHTPIGTADLTWNAKTHTSTVVLSLTGLAPNSIHPAHIHTGSCSNVGSVVHPLNNVVADAKGVGTSTTENISVIGGIPATGWSINVHQGPDLNNPKSTDVIQNHYAPLACADVKNTNTSKTTDQSVTGEVFQGTSASNQMGSGSAQVTYDSKTKILTVKVTARGLVPNSTHVDHIHTGSCKSQGGVLYALNPLKADSTGSVTETTTTAKNVASFPDSGWYINVHNGATMQNLTPQSGFDPIACGDVA